MIFCHGNVHTANAVEVGELYRAVELLNRSGTPTWLVRTGRDSAAFAANIPASVRPHLIEIGFVKRTKDLPTLMSLADIFVQPGRAGAFNDFRFPSKLPEFFAISRPVVLPATNLGSALQHRRDAYVLPEANAETIADAISEITTDSALRDALTNGALPFAAQKFSWPRSAEQVLSFFHQHTSLGHPTESDMVAAQTVSAAFASSGAD
ncbi:MAG: glycosyltransferase family 4 protein [Candidatus Synoicihabitans palmerolidicus]|nr:glycosyltransferase family 4 protein [Candidatus Synoicihabitans palmerolidicus]